MNVIHFCRCRSLKSSNLFGLRTLRSVKRDMQVPICLCDVTCLEKHSNVCEHTCSLWRPFAIMGTVMKHPVPDRVKPSFVIFDIRTPVWHRMLHSCTHMATVGVRGLDWSRDIVPSCVLLVVAWQNDDKINDTAMKWQRHICVSHHHHMNVTVLVGCRLVRAIHVGTVQGAVSHALYRLWSVPAAEYDRRLVDHGQYVDRCHLLRHVRRSRHHSHSIIRHF